MTRERGYSAMLEEHLEALQTQALLNTPDATTTKGAGQWIASGPYDSYEQALHERARAK